MSKSDLLMLTAKLGYEFKNISLMEHALSHRSFGKNNNERLEFLGDAALNFTIAAALYQLFPDAKEGDLSRLRASLVKGEALAAIAAHFDLGKYLRLGIGEQRSGGSNRASIQADALEAIIGAIYLDSDFITCEAVILQWYEAMLDSMKTPQELKDPKTRLQEYLQARKFPLPKYDILETRGEAHSQIFHIECKVEGLDYKTVGIGSSRRKAEQDAAQKYYEQLKNE